MEPVEAVMRLYPKVFYTCHTRHVRDPEAAVTLTSNQVSILHHLDLDDPVTMTTLAEHLGVRPATASLAIDRLERLGYVRREKPVADKRLVQVLLTEAGDRIRSAEEVLDRGLVSRMLSELGEAEQRDAVRGLRLLAEAAERVAAQMAGRRGREGAAWGR